EHTDEGIWVGLEVMQLRAFIARVPDQLQSKCTSQEDDLKYATVEGSAGNVQEQRHS
ncbi:multidrug resistance-associated protein 6, partial [Sigmodon hispidus]